MNRCLKIFFNILFWTILGASVGFIIGGISLLSNDWSLDFTQSDLDTKICIGCYRPYFTTREVNNATVQYCCIRDPLSSEDFLFYCETSSVCKNQARYKFDSYQYRAKQDAENGTIMISISSIVLIVCIFFQVRSCVRSYRRTRLQAARALVLFQHLIQEIEERHQHQQALQAALLSEDRFQSFISPSEDQCSVCFEAFNVQKVIKTTCGHEFHKNCIKQWMKTSRKCPLCRELLF